MLPETVINTVSQFLRRPAFLLLYITEDGKLVISILVFFFLSDRLKIIVSCGKLINITFTFLDIS